MLKFENLCLFRVYNYEVSCIDILSKNIPSTSATFWISHPFPSHPFAPTQRATKSAKNLGAERTVERIGEENGGKGDGHKDQEVVPVRSPKMPEKNFHETCSAFSAKFSAFARSFSQPGLDPLH